jgi:nucleotide-binding universal stress UspA family protein
MFSPKNILVPTDFSEPSDQALKKAIDIASQHKAKIYLLHVIDQAIRQCAVDYCLDYAVVKQLEQDSEKVSKEMLEQEVKKVLQSQEIDIEYDVQHGTPADIILKEQENKNIDLTVIASHGKTGIKKVLMGSVAEKVLKGSKSPVLLVK